MDFLGGLLSGVSSLVGGLFGQRNQAQINQQNIQEQELFAQSGLQWRAQDATKAQTETGINRLALLGVPTNSFSNVVGSNDLGQGVAAAGQDIGRAITAGNPQLQRERELNLQLLQAKIDNVNSDTIRQTAEASALARKFASPGTARTPMPPEDPRGPVIPLVQRARDPRTGEIVWIPSEKAASPLQTLAAMPTNAALAGRGMSEGLMGLPGSSDNWGLPAVRPDVFRNVDPSSFTAMY